MKKFLSLLLSSIMVLSLLPVQMIGVNAEETSGVKAPLFNLSNYLSVLFLLYLVDMSFFCDDIIFQTLTFQFPAQAG